MAFSFEINRDLAGATTLEKLVAQIISTDPAASAAATQKTIDQIERVKRSAIRITGARMRRVILEAYTSNTLNWPKHKEYSNWFGRLGPVTMSHLIRANRPKRALTKSGNTRASGYSQSYAVKPPQEYQLGGKLAKATRYKAGVDSLTVGILAKASKEALKMERFQDGGLIPLRDGGMERSRRYLATMGIFVRRNTLMRAEPRPLYDKIQKLHPPTEVFKTAFVDLLTEKLRLGE